MNLYQSVKLGIATLLVSLGISSCSSKHKREPEVPKPQGWQLVWADEFDRSDIFATGDWAKIPRGKPDWCNTMSDHESLFDIKDGVMILRGRRNDVLPEDPSQHLTGGVYTRGKRRFDLGRIEVRCKLQAAQGAWPAIWMMPHKGEWPKGGEIDIMERLNFDSFVHQTLHTNYTWHLKIKDPVPTTTAPIKPDDYNVYAVEIHTDKLRFFVNGQLTLSYPRIKGLENKGQFPFGKDFFLLIDMQLGGQWVGEVRGLDKPVEMHIDWVRYYQWR